VYADLFTETMLLYCGARHPLFGQDHAGLDWDSLRAWQFAGLGYHSPNMELSHGAAPAAQGHGFRPGIDRHADPVGPLLGFLPDHYAEAFERQGLMQAVQPTQFFYRCQLPFWNACRGSFCYGWRHRAPG
jgi:hypothetical protein